MPTYAYVCSKCGREFEYFQSMSAAPLKHCPSEHCTRQPWGRGRVQRQLSAGAGLLFRGSGFYITDYRSDSFTRAAKQEAGAAQPAKDGATKNTPASATAAPAKGGSGTPARSPSAGSGNS